MLWLWRPLSISETYLSHHDDRVTKDDEIFGLFNSSVTLTKYVLEAIRSVAPFLLRRDLTKNSEDSRIIEKGLAQEMVSELCLSSAPTDRALIAILHRLVTDNGVGRHDYIRFEVVRDVLNRVEKPVLSTMDVEHDRMCEDVLAVDANLSKNLPMAKELQLYTSLTKTELLTILQKLISYKDGDFREGR